MGFETNDGAPSNDHKFKKLKRVVIKEEFVALTGDIAKAIILNQFIYWSERVQDFDQFIAEEQARCQQDGTMINIQLTNGWIYKSSEELSEETMLNLSVSNIRKHLKDLISKGWISERTNPVHKWDRTKQYRVNLAKIHKDLQKLGYLLQDYKVDVPFFETKNAFSVLENGSCETENRSSNLENQTLQNRKAIPEITTEITNKDYNQSIYPSTDKDNVTLADEPDDQSTDGWTDGLPGVMRRLDQNSERHETPQASKVIKQLCENTGASINQVREAVRRANQLEKEGKLKGNYLKLVESIARTVIQEDLVKNSGLDDYGGTRQNTKKDLIKSLYRS